jgi:hypothetical protein
MEKFILMIRLSKIILKKSLKIINDEIKEKNYAREIRIAN